MIALKFPIACLRNWPGHPTPVESGRDATFQEISDRKKELQEKLNSVSR